MKTCFVFLLGMLAIIQANGQRPVPVADDAFARNLLTTVNRVHTILEQPKDHLKLLAGSLDSVTKGGAPIYSATIVLPGSICTGIEKVSNNLEKGTVKWEWFARFVNESKKKTDVAAVTRLKQAIDTLLTSFTVKQQGVSMYTSGTIEQSWNDECILDLRISFMRPLKASPQQLRDSLVALYLPVLKNKEFTNAASKQFLGALDIEGFSNEEKTAIIMPVVKEVVNHDFYAGYLFVLNRPYYIQNYNAALTVEQRERVSKTARQEIDAYYASFAPKKSPVVQQQQKQAAEKIPDDPCEKEIYYLKNKPGYYISYNGTIALIAAYSCPANTYTICYVDAKGKLVFNKNIAMSSLDNAQRSSSSPFIICSNCSGQGYFMEYDWYDMNSYTGHYARSNKQRQITCGVCSGTGHIKVR